MVQEKTDFLITGAGVLYLMVGILLATALFFLTIYIGLNKNRSYLFFSSYAFIGALSLLFLRNEQMVSFLIIFTLSCLFLLWFFLKFFDVFKSKATLFSSLGLILFTAAAFSFFEEKNETIFQIIAWFTFLITLMACSWISLRAFNNQQYGGRLLFYTTALVFLLNLFLISESFFISSVGIASSMLILAVSYTVLRDIQKQKELMKSLRIKAVHLENEMLKKSIQPHFLLNTLTILSEWIEERPALAAKQIELLSQEFRFITRVSGENLIPVREELKICQVHLDIFNAKKESHYTLEAKNIKGGTQVPPLIFHTLIENGLTHSYSKSGWFLIEQKEHHNETQFRVTAGPLAEKAEKGEGLGHSYIESRLEQAFPERWSLISGAKNNMWETLITISK